MLIVGERINSTRKSIQDAIKARDAAFILKQAEDQIAQGAHFVDVNCAVTSGDEVQDIDWVVSIIQSGIKNVRLCIDSPNPMAIERALEVYKAGGDLMINSITADDDRINAILPLAIKYNTRLVALTMDEKGMPDTAMQRSEIAGKIMSRVESAGFDTSKLYFDPLTRPISTEPSQAMEFLKSIALIKGLGNVKTICGLSNVSFGLPNRKVINSAFVTMALAAGLDAAILDPLDKYVMSDVLASRALLVQDEYCGDYIKAFREGRLA